MKDFAMQLTQKCVSMGLLDESYSEWFASGTVKAGSKMIKRQRFSSNRGSRCLFCLADNPTLLPAAPRFLSHASFIKEQVLLHDACF